MSNIKYHNKKNEQKNFKKKSGEDGLPRSYAHRGGGYADFGTRTP